MMSPGVSGRTKMMIAAAITPIADPDGDAPPREELAEAPGRHAAALDRLPGAVGEPVGGGAQAFLLQPHGVASEATIATLNPSTTSTSAVWATSVTSAS